MFAPTQNTGHGRYILFHVVLRYCAEGRVPMNMLMNNVTGHIVWRLLRFIGTDKWMHILIQTEAERQMGESEAAWWNSYLGYVGG